MKKRQFKITSHRFGFGALVSVLLLLVATVTSCSKENDSNSLPDGKYPMNFNASVEEEVDTRSTETKSLSGKEVAVSVNGEVKMYKAVSDNKLEAGNGVTPWYWLNSNEEKTITAWYPYSTTHPTSFTVKADQSDGDGIGYKQSDVLYAKERNIKFADRDDNIYFKHLPAKLVVKIKKGHGVTDDEVAFATVNILNQATTGTINNDGSVDQVESGSESIKTYTLTNTQKTCVALLVPQQMKNKPFIKVTIGNNDYLYTPKNDADANLKSGKEYTYNITVNKNNITVTGGGPSSWTGKENNISSEVQKN